MMRRERSSAQALGGPLLRRIKESRVLLVGAGGIGCELLKNLVCTSFGTGLNVQNAQNGTAPALHTSPPVRAPGIVVIDLDTIDLSNLNRQFLFRKHHVKKPKALVAKETASQFNPYANIEAHHASIFDNQYDVKFFEGFDVVFNALDNVAARRHVNRMCLAANVPLIESGTTGFNGQVQVIKKGVAECYDCNPKPVQKSFPICTIRSTPSQPIHCIVWAKSYLLTELFGTSEEDSAVTVTDADNAEEVAKLREEAQALKKMGSLIGSGKFAQAVFEKVFREDIERLRSMSDMWKGKTPPEPLEFAAFNGEEELVEQGKTLSTSDQRLWTLEENVAMFCYSLDTLSNRAQNGESVIEFDKDDKDTLDFVAAAANLRSHIFSIPTKSEWEIKQMAGNIIPAIATSNALTAGLCVLEAFKIIKSTPGVADALSKPTLNNNLPTKTANSNLSGRIEKPLGGAKMVFLASARTDKVISTEMLQPPQPHCPVCSPVYAKLVLPKTGSATLKDLVSLLKDSVKYEGFSIITEQGIIYDPDLEDNLDKTLNETGIDAKSISFITVSDDSDDPKVDLVLSTTVDETEESSHDLGLLPTKIWLPPKPKAPDPPAEAQTNGKTEAEPAQLGKPGEKRKRGAEEDVEVAAKRPNFGGSDDQAIEIQDDGAIALDD